MNSEFKRTPPTDRPWPWFALFACVAAFGVLIIAPKYVVRRQALDTNFEGRQAAWRQRLDPENDSAVANPGASSTDLIVLITGVAAGGLGLAALFALVARAKRRSYDGRSPVGQSLGDGHGER